LGIGEEAKNQIKLRCDKDTGHDYCALSYCRGDRTNNFGITTTENISKRINGFLATDLLQTLQDTIVLCKRLGISYLWVDSICIVQDDLKDWEVESSLMDEIYGNALFRLIVTASNHANKRLFPHE
jgi:Heterokaryon incompatibility protein (HET)